jgi:hypothetical protein
MKLCHLALSAALFFGFAGVAAAQQQSQQQPGATGSTEPIGAQISFHTMDNDLQQVSVQQIWRIRPALSSDEPRGSIVVYYGWSRLFVKDGLNDVVEKVNGHSSLVKLTSPGGAPVYIPREKVIGISRPLAYKHHQNTKAIVVAREGEQQVQETREAVTEALK